MPTVEASHNPDPYSGYNFLLKWDEVTYAGFQEASGLYSTQTAGANRGSTHITLRRGITNSDELWEWRSDLMSGKADHKNVSIILVDDQAQEKIRWNLINCLPTTLNGPSKGTSDEVAIETLELTHEGITVDKGS